MLSPKRVPIRARRVTDYCPNTSPARLIERLQVGDIVLVANGILDWVRPIVTFQKQFEKFPPASKKFTHAGIYIGQGKIVHSMPDVSLDGGFAGGVCEIPIQDFFTDGVTFAVLRFPGLKVDHHEALRDAVNLHVGNPYDYKAILRCLSFIPPIGRMRRRARAQRRAPDRNLARALVCTDFLYVVYDEVFQHKNPFNLPGGYLTPVRLPCELYSNPNFADVDLDDRP